MSALENYGLWLSVSRVSHQALVDIQKSQLKTSISQYSSVCSGNLEEREPGLENIYIFLPAKLKLQFPVYVKYKTSYGA
jgi:hypothetical protein